MARTKEGSIIATEALVAERKLKFTVFNGKDGASRKVLGELVLDLTKVSKSNLDYAAFHGFKQRIADKAALGFDGKTYATPEQKLEAMGKLVEFYNSGAAEWSMKRSERVGSDELMLCRALAEVFPGKGADELRKIVAGWTKEQRTAMMLKPEIKAVVERLQAEAAASVDTEELLLNSGLI